MVTISFFNLTFNLTNGFFLEDENLISKSLKPFFCFIKFIAEQRFFLVVEEIVPLMPSLPTNIVPYIHRSFNLIRISL